MKRQAISRLFKILFWFICLAVPGFAFSQPVQTIRGTISDADSRSRLPGAAVAVFKDSVLFGGMYADESGTFRIENVPVGRITIKATYLGYEPLVIPNIMLNSGKEIVLNLEMREKVVMGDSVLITAGSRSETRNEMATVSARPFTIEETQRYAGTKNDPSRMAQNFAGVTGANDSRNDIVIRGNSPSGVLWRLEGVDIPNPNHFATFGTTGGPISMLNNNVLANSDFFTGAFPAEYGNAIAGVFDLKMRTGNNEQREFTAQFGMNGIELLAEGPFKKNKKASYLIAYRYNNLALYNKLGVKFGSSAIPTFTDLSFKISIPTTKFGTFSMFGVGGYSTGTALDKKRDTLDFYGPSGTDIYFTSKMGAGGIVHTLPVGKKGFLRTTAAGTFSQMNVTIDNVDRITKIASGFYRNYSSQEKISFNVLYSQKISSRHTIKTGIFADNIYSQLLDSVYLSSISRFVTLTDFKGATWFLQPYAQWKFRVNEKLTLNAGVHYQVFLENKTGSPEPRLGLKQQVGKNNFFGLAYGLHSQLQPLFVYYARRPWAQGINLPNHDLKMLKSHHFVASWDRSFKNSIRLKSEVYYQRVFNSGIERVRQSSFSLLNAGADFWSAVPDSGLVNAGTGRNFGAEITFEKFLTKNYYFLVTLSAYDSKYKGSDGVLRNTSYNGHFTGNVLGGADFKLRKDGKFILGLNGKVTLAGGKRYTPIDPVLSAQNNSTYFIDSLAWTAQTKPYFRADFRTSFRINGKKVSQEIAVDISNILNTQNVLFLTYDPGTARVREVYQLGRLPIIQYKIEF